MKKAVLILLLLVGMGSWAALSAVGGRDGNPQLRPQDGTSSKNLNNNLFCSLWKINTMNSHAYYDYYGIIYLI